MTVSPPPILDPTELSLGLSESMADCEERKRFGGKGPENTISKILLKAYLSSLNVCLSELGWTPQSILDVGCGDGSLLTYVGQNFLRSEVVGVEFDEATLARAKDCNCCKIQFHQVGMTDALPFSDDYFDVVISHGFLGWAENPGHWIQEMVRVSAEAVIVSAPLVGFANTLAWVPGAKKATLVGKPVFEDGQHKISTKTLTSQLKAAGCSVELVLKPWPYTMLLARKPQSAKTGGNEPQE